MRVLPSKRALRVSRIGGNRPVDRANSRKTLRSMGNALSISAFFSCVASGLCISIPWMRGLPLAWLLAIVSANWNHKLLLGK